MQEYTLQSEPETTDMLDAVRRDLKARLADKQVRKRARRQLQADIERALNQTDAGKVMRPAQVRAAAKQIAMKESSAALKALKESQ